MSVLVTIRIAADTAKFREYADGNEEQLRSIAEDGKSQGALSHRFGLGDGEVVVYDEWESAEQFQRFFEGNAQIGEVMQAAGAQGEPEIIVTEAVRTADQF